MVLQNHEENGSNSCMMNESLTRSHSDLALIHLLCMTTKTGNNERINRTEKNENKKNNIGSIGTGSERGEEFSGSLLARHTSYPYICLYSMLDTKVSSAWFIGKCKE